MHNYYWEFIIENNIYFWTYKYLFLDIYKYLFLEKNKLLFQIKNS